MDLREWLKAHATTTSVAERARGARGPRGSDARAGGDDRAGRSEGGATVDLGPGRRPTIAAQAHAGADARRRKDGARGRRGSHGAAPGAPPAVSQRDFGPRPARAAQRRASCPGSRWGWRSSRSASRAFSPEEPAGAARARRDDAVHAPRRLRTTLATPPPPPVTAAPGAGLRRGRRQGRRLGEGRADRPSRPATTTRRWPRRSRRCARMPRASRPRGSWPRR